MPIRCLREIPTVCEWPMSALQGDSVAVDGFWFIRKYFKNLILQEMIEDIDTYVVTNMKPFFHLFDNIDVIWIWDGMRYEHTFQSPDDELMSKIKIFSKYNNLPSFKAGKVLELLVNPINRLLESKGISYCRAPYGAIAQCIYYLKASCVQHIFTKTDAFLYKDVSRIIVEFDFTKKFYCALDRIDVEREVRGKRHQFRHYAIASGCELCPTIPSLAADFSIEALQSLFAPTSKVINGEDVETSDFETQVESDPEYKKAFNAAIYFCKWHPVMTLEGEVTPLDTNFVSLNARHILGEKLSNRFYQSLFLCKIEPSALERLVFVEATTVGATDDLLELITNIMQTEHTRKFTGTDVIEMIKETFDITIMHDGKLNETLELVFMHFLRNKKTESISTPLINCLVPEKNLDKNISDNNLDKNISGKYVISMKYVSEFDLQMIFRIREYINTVKLLNLVLKEYKICERIMDKFEGADFKLENVLEPLDKTHYTEFLSKNGEI